MKLEKITIKISEDKTLDLTPDQAQELLLLLESTLPKKKIEYPLIPYQTPFPKWPNDPQWWNPIITCGTSNSTDSYGVEFALK